MNIIVCIKQVPGTTNVNIDPVTGTLIRDGVAAKMNPYDLEALELGLQLIERTEESSALFPWDRTRHWRCCVKQSTWERMREY